MLGLSLVAIYLVWQSLRGVSRILLDRWWLDTVTDAPVWSRRTAAQLQLGFGTAAVVVLVLGSSVYLLLRDAATDHGQTARPIERYRSRMGPAHGWALVALTAYLTWHIGRAAAGNWQLWLLFRHGGDTGLTAPEVGGDVGFYLFRLPLLRVASSFLRQLVLVTLIVSALGHIASGALRWPRGRHRSSALAVTHLSLLASVFLGLQAAHQVVVARALTAVNRIGAFDGPGYTEINVTRPALVVAALGCIATGFALVSGGRTRAWRTPSVIAGVTVMIHVIGLVVAPALTERFIVAPAEAQRQLWSIEHNLDATRTAYGLDDIVSELQPVVDGAGGALTPLFGDERGIPLFSTGPMTNAIQVLAGTAGTRVLNVDLASYEIDGVERPVYTAARPSSRPDLPERGWVQEHLVYTHGDGVVALLADVADVDGRPDLTPIEELDGATHSPLYFGEGLNGWYAITGTRRTEANGAVYRGDGIALRSFGRRLALALAVGESQPLVSSELTDDSLLLYRRGLTERLSSLAPFLALDGDPYAVVDGDRVVWVVDAYTTARTYPYSQFLPSGGNPQLNGTNYVHASVLATVDAADGTVHLYRTLDGDDDPILTAWSKVFPGLFESIDQLPDSVAEHIRYPDDLFSVQTQMLGRYHVSDAELLFSGVDRWTVSPAVATTVAGDSSGPAPAVDLFATGDQFETIRTYGPGAAGNPGATRDELSAMAVANHSVDRGMRVLIPDGPRLGSTQVAQSAIDADPDLAQQITLLNANGSHVEFGPMTPILIGDGIVWARSIIVIGTSAASAPRLFGVAVVSKGLVGIGPTLTAAIEAAR